MYKQTQSDANIQENIILIQVVCLMCEEIVKNCADC
jgi:hypothetical protein